MTNPTQSLDTRLSPHAPVVLSVFRVVFGLLFLCHATSHLFGWPLASQQATLSPAEFNGRIPAGRYVARVIDYRSVDKAFSGRISFAGPTPAIPATPERWTLTCRVGGRVAGTQQVLVGRGQRVDAGSACGG